jgi:hypothetical protein
MVRASELPQKFVGVIIAAARPAEATAPQTGADTATKPATEAVRPETSLTVEERAKISRMQGDLMWLVREGYVTEFIDGRLFAPPPMVEARKREVESSEHDPENFPEAPTATAAQPPAESKGVDEPAIETETPASEPGPDSASTTEEPPIPDSPVV